jgi:hypothetical protein
MFGLTSGPNGEGNYVRMLDDFKMGPNLVRGFQPAGLGPRALETSCLISRLTPTRTRRHAKNEIDPSNIGGSPRKKQSSC